jgi:hypothetical protein
MQRCATVVVVLVVAELCIVEMGLCSYAGMEHMWSKSSRCGGMGYMLQAPVVLVARGLKVLAAVHDLLAVLELGLLICMRHNLVDSSLF